MIGFFIISLGFILDLLFITFFDWLFYIVFKIVNIKDHKYPGILEHYRYSYNYAFNNYKKIFTELRDYFYD